MSPRRRRWLALVCAGSVMAACGGDAPATVAIPHVFDLAHDPTAGIQQVSTDRGEVMGADALRNTLESALTWHGITLVETMRAIESGSPDADAWIAALTHNTDDIVAAIGQIYGPVGANAFYQQWAQHTQFLADYAQAVGAGDDDALALARTKLQAYTSDSGHFFETATAGGLTADVVTELLNTHVGHMQAMIDAIGDGDTAAGLASALDDNSYLSTIAQGLSTAIAAQDPTAFPGEIDGPVGAFCSLVTRETGDYLLRQLFSPTPVTTEDDQFANRVGVPLNDVLGPLDGLAAPDAATRVSTAGQAIRAAMDVGRAGATTPA